MSALRRGFLAVVPPPEVLRWTDSVVDSTRQAGDGLRWTRPEQRHLTLQFLGGVEDVDALVASVAASVRGIAPFTLALGGAGAFPAAARASVVWLGVSTGADRLAELAAAIVAAPGGRPFRPHLTIARARAPRDLCALVEHLRRGSAGPPWTVDEVVLFESDTRADGAVHTPQIEFGLGGEG